VSGGPARARTWALLVALVPVCAWLALCLGPKALSWGEVAAALVGGRDGSLAADIVHTVRGPQVALGLLVGAALAVAGAVFQGLLRNDLVEPYLLGVGPGAMLGVTVAALAVGGSTMPPAAVRGPAAFVGAAVVAALVFSAARRATRMPAATVLLAGIAVGAFVHAVATVLLHAGVRDWHKVILWLLGDLSLARYGEVGWLVVALVVGLAVATWRARDLDVLALGEESARATGVDARRALWVLGGAACLLAAATVAHAGLVGFVGLVVPHLARGVVGPAHRALIPASALLGAALLVIADGLARTLHPPQGLPLAAVTALLGAPVLAVLVLRRA
jgi:iron complex transport system permease protein